MITILSFIPPEYIKTTNNDCNLKTITLFSSVKTAILPQTFSNWELFLITNVKNVTFEDSANIDPRIKIIYTPDSYFNLNSLYNINDEMYNLKCKYISIFDLENDIWNINKLQIQYDVIETNNYDIVGCECSPSSECIPATTTQILKSPNASLFHACPFLISTILIKKELFKSLSPEIAVYETNICNHTIDQNFMLINSSFNTVMAQFHSLLLHMTLRECQIYYIGYSKNNENKKQPQQNHNIRIINNSLVETSSQQKLSNLYNNKTCEHIFFINSNEYLREKYMRIKFFSDFCSSETCKQKYETLCRVHEIVNYGQDKYLNITNGNTYTHAILLNCPIVSDISVPHECVLGLACEPIPYLKLSYDFIDFADKHVGAYYIGYKHPKLTSPIFKEFHGFMWYTEPPAPETIIKNVNNNNNNIISLILSNKLQAPGHAYRHKLAMFILKHNLPIDIWGTGALRYVSKFPNHKNIKGPFKDKEPYMTYSLSICIENYQHPHYFSEKITNCLVCNTTPIYLGCSEIETYFPNQVIHLSGDIKEDAGLLVKITRNPNDYIREIKTSENDNVLNLMKNLPW